MTLTDVYRIIRELQKKDYSPHIGLIADDVTTQMEELNLDADLIHATATIVAADIGARLKTELVQQIVDYFDRKKLAGTKPVEAPPVPKEKRKAPGKNNSPVKGKSKNRPRPLATHKKSGGMYVSWQVEAIPDTKRDQYDIMAAKQSAWPCRCVAFAPETQEFYITTPSVAKRRGHKYITFPTKVPKRGDAPADTPLTDRRIDHDVQN